MTSVSVRINQSELFPAVMSTLHKLCVHHADDNGGCNNSVSSVFVMVSENICTVCLENFHTEYGKCAATVPLFSETFNKQVSGHRIFQSENPFFIKAGSALDEVSIPL